MLRTRGFTAAAVLTLAIGIGAALALAIVGVFGVVTLLAAALSAAWIPALRAARVDPLVALRYE